MPLENHMRYIDLGATNSGVYVVGLVGDSDERDMEMTSFEVERSISLKWDFRM